MNTTIIAVRHGETEWNKIEKQQGHLNSDLTELGIRQAYAMADGLKGFNIEYFYSSDLGRAIETSLIISKAINIKFIPETRLRERNLGILQGLTKGEFNIKHPEDYEKLKSNDPDYRIPNGESIRDRYVRCISCVEDFSKIHFGKTILIVSHGGILMSLIHKALEIPLTSLRNYSLFNGSINVFSISENSKWRLEIWGDVSHLRANSLATIDDN
ncbi:MAG TPA: histidine phosphatase family protein [Fibrobacteres bacterium]|jgi:2,3-bisphosphoglycerate-dependent phosphoglycerate mutase|nr:histidine phosphatase family protein [Fibrobacterota bacterium]